MSDIKGYVTVQGRIVAEIEFDTPKDERGTPIPVREGSFVGVLMVDPNGNALSSEGRLQ